MVNPRPSIDAAAPSPAPVLIGSAEDAAQAFGERSGLHLFVAEWLARPRPAPLILTQRVREP